VLLLSRKIAIVDDSTPFCLLVQQLLETDNCTVDMYNTATDFLRIPSRLKVYNLIIMDINLPDMDGLTALKTLKSDPITEAIPVLLLSGDSRANTVKTGVKFGAKDFMTKPIDPAQLIERVSSLLSG
jgi:DNA-binding response OmpR family regulator